MEQVAAIIAQIRESGQPITAANGNVITKYKDMVLIDDNSTGPSAGTVFRPTDSRNKSNVDWYVRKYLEENS